MADKSVTVFQIMADLESFFTYNINVLIKDWPISFFGYEGSKEDGHTPF